MALFVIQLHAARALHYDFRLELGGVLVSWAVPKGPSLSPKVRRLAVRVPDHEVEHADFEGVFPDSPPGRGGCLIWDRGTWRTDSEDAAAALGAGKLAFTLEGDKLHGRWYLVRTEPQSGRESWLLFKGRDEHADDEVDITATRPESVVSGKTLDELYRSE